MRLRKAIVYIVSIVLLTIFIIFISGYRLSSEGLIQELNREMKYTPSTIVYNRTKDNTAIVVSKFGTWIVCRQLHKSQNFLWKFDGEYLEPINLAKQDPRLTEEEIITNYANQCLWLKDPIPDVAISEAALKSLSIGFVSSITRFNIDSRRYISSGVETKASIEFDTGDAIISGVVTTWFNMTPYGWVVDITKLSVSNVSAKTEPPIENVMSDYDKVNQVYAIVELGYFAKETKLVAQQIDLPHGKASYTFKKSAGVGSWNAELTYTVRAEYKFPTGWEFTVPADWKFVETISWVGTWDITLVNRDASGVRTVAKIKNMVITGKIAQLSIPYPGTATFPSSLQATFTLNGKSYTLPGIADPYQRVSISTVRRIIFKFGPSDNDQIGLEYSFVDQAGTGKEVAEYSSSGLGYTGTLVKIR
jgi:hypothetical protein